MRDKRGGAMINGISTCLFHHIKGVAWGDARILISIKSTDFPVKIPALRCIFNSNPSITKGALFRNSNDWRGKRSPIKGNRNNIQPLRVRAPDWWSLAPENADVVREILKTTETRKTRPALTQCPLQVGLIADRENLSEQINAIRLLGCQWLQGAKWPCIWEW